jgi:hypothetical protein
MATASAREYCDLLVTGSRRICAHHDFVSKQTGRAWVKHGQASHHFFHDIFGTVNELFHDKANVQRRPTSDMMFAPAGLSTMIVVPFVRYMLTLGYDPRKMVFFGLVVLASSFWCMSSLNLEIAERDIILPRIVRALGAGIITVPVSTIIFRFLPKTESSQAEGCMH